MKCLGIWVVLALALTLHIPGNWVSHEGRKPATDIITPLPKNANGKEDALTSQSTPVLLFTLPPFPLPPSKPT